MKIIDFFARWGVFLFYRLGIGQWWSRTYQWLWERKTREPLKRFSGIGELASYVRGLKWRADTWRELGDATSHPEAIQYRANHNPEHFIGDCDEFGHYISAVITNEIQANPRWGGIDKAYLLTVMWKKTGGKEWEGNHKGYGGHNVCLIRYQDGTWAYMDYGPPSQRRSEVAAVVKDVRDAYAQEYQGLGWLASLPTSLGLVMISRE